MKRLVTSIALAVAVAACNGDVSDPTLAAGPTSSTVGQSTTADPASGTSGAPSSSLEPPTNSPTSSSSVAPVPSAPLPNPEEDDLPTIWRELMEYHNWAFANPELADAGEYIAESCDCFERATAILAEYVENGWSAVGDGIIVHSVEVEVEASTFALMTVVDEQAELTIFGPNGEEVEVIERRPKTFFDVRVRLTEDGWRIAEWNQRGAEGAAE